jgi:UDP-glucose 4-epimerase
MMKILITGAAGYIGSVITEKLIDEGHSVIALDNLQQGHRNAVSPEASFYKISLGNKRMLDNVLAAQKPDAVVHLAANSLVGESECDPKKYYETNLVYGINLLDTMLKNQVKKLVFSSTAAIYGNVKQMPITENHKIEPPINVYGESKLMLERLFQRYAEAYGLKFITFRYFNAAGATPKYGEYHNPETHLIPNILKVALGQMQHVSIFGTDYPTEDGTCIRDYVHVNDIASAHIIALRSLLNGTHCNKTYNLGNSKGYSVLEVVETAIKVTGAQIPLIFHPRRPGDPPILVADSTLAKSEMGWSPHHHDLENVIEDAWKWHREHPYGYRRNRIK